MKRRLELLNLKFKHSNRNKNPKPGTTETEVILVNTNPAQPIIQANRTIHGLNVVNDTQINENVEGQTEIQKDTYNPPFFYQDQRISTNNYDYNAEITNEKAELYSKRFEKLRKFEIQKQISRDPKFYLKVHGISGLPMINKIIRNMVEAFSNAKLNKSDASEFLSLAKTFQFTGRSISDIESFLTNLRGRFADQYKKNITEMINSVRGAYSLPGMD